jgi:hypothetical protein
MKKAVRGAQAPLFFVQAENDFDTTPSLALSAEMESARKPHAVKIFPPHGTTHMAGHAHFCNHGMSEWGDVHELIGTARRPCVFCRVRRTRIEGCVAPRAREIPITI